MTWNVINKQFTHKVHYKIASMLLSMLLPDLPCLWYSSYSFLPSEQACELYPSPWIGLLHRAPFPKNMVLYINSNI